MSEYWEQEYCCLAFRIDTLVQAAYGSPFVEAYYGPPEWRQKAEAEPETVAADLVRQAMSLADALPVQGFSASRTAFLEKQVKAMEMLCRKLCGESFSLEEEARYYLDITPQWTPEAQFEQAHALYEKVLPGLGSLRERLYAYRLSLAFPLERRDTLKDIINQSFAEARRRTATLLELPYGETIDIEYFAEWEHEAAAYYQGNFRTQIVMNLAATAAYMSRLFDHKVCHEGYPGHHTEYVMKELHLFREQGYVEQALCLTLCPQRVVEEGIAQMAHEMIFSEGEAEQWICEHVYLPLQIEVDPTTLLQLRRASEMLNGVWDNAQMLLDEGRSEQEVAQYFTTYMLLAEESAAGMVAHLKHPIWGRNELTYASGKKLVRRWLQAPDKVAVFHRLLTEQFTPSQLEQSAH